MLSSNQNRSLLLTTSTRRHYKRTHEILTTTFREQNDRITTTSRYKYMKDMLKHNDTSMTVLHEINGNVQRLVEGCDKRTKGPNQTPQQQQKFVLEQKDTTQGRGGGGGFASFSNNGREKGDDDDIARYTYMNEMLKHNDKSMTVLLAINENLQRLVEYGKKGLEQQKQRKNMLFGLDGNELTNNPIEQQQQQQQQQKLPPSPPLLHVVLPSPPSSSSQQRRRIIIPESFTSSNYQNDFDDHPQIATKSATTVHRLKEEEENRLTGFAILSSLIFVTLYQSFDKHFNLGDWRSVLLLYRDGRYVGLLTVIVYLCSTTCGILASLHSILCFSLSLLYLTIICYAGSCGRRTAIDNMVDREENVLQNGADDKVSNEYDSSFLFDKTGMLQQRGFQTLAWSMYAFVIQVGIIVGILTSKILLVGQG